MPERPHRWRKYRCENAASGVEVAFDGRTVLARDSKRPDGAVLTFDCARWVSFLNALRV